jgi:biopolymer transport protein ExbD
MKPDDDLTPRLPAWPDPDIVLEVKEEGYLLDGKRVRKSSLPAELARAASHGSKVLEIRASGSISTKRIKYVLEALQGSGFEEILLPSNDATIRKRSGGQTTNRDR